MSAIKLSMPDLLPKVWAVYMAKELQAQAVPSPNCSYAGPCAIGVGIPETQRDRLDRAVEGSTIDALVQNGKVQIPNTESVSEYSKLQGVHDRWSFANSLEPDRSQITEQAFLDYLVTLSKKYGVEIPDAYS